MRGLDTNVLVRLFTEDDPEQARRVAAPDYLLGWLNRRAGCEQTLTFDRKLAKVEGYSLLA